MTHLSKKILLCFCLCLGITAVNAQYRIDHWTADDGLPQNSVYGIVQTGDGYLWLATVDGLARFDGLRFTVFNKSNSPGIVNNRFISLFEAADGDLWAGTEESDVMRLQKRRFTSYGVEQGLISSNVSRISGDADGNPIVISNNFQIYRFADEKFLAFDAETDSPQAAPLARAESVPVLCFYNSDKKQTACLVNGRWFRPSLADGLPISNIINSVQDADGTLWLLTSDAGLVHLENGKAARIYTKQDGLPETPLFLVSGARLSLLSKDKQGAVWLTDLKTMRTELLSRQPPTSLTEFVSSYEDNEGNIWLGTTRNGLFRVRKQVITAYSKADGLSENNVYPIFEDRRGVVWIGATGGVHKYQDGVFTLVESWKDFTATAIGEDAVGRVLVSNFNDVFVLEGDQFRLFYRNPSGINYAMHADRDGSLWVGGDGGLTRLKDGIVTVYTTNNGLAANDVKVIIDDKNGGLWIGAYGGLTHYKDGQFISWTEKDGLPSRTIRALYLDADGALWIGSYDGGLARFKDGKFTHYNTKIGLYNDGAFQILEDADRNFWISSNRGLYRVSRDELNEFAEGKRKTITSVAYGKSDGMLNAECNGGRSPAGTKTRDGRLWFPTQDGVAVIDPETIKANPKPPPVIIETIKIDNILSEPPLPTSVSSATDSNVSEEPSAAADGSDLIINPNQQNFEISYTALSFINSENLRFKYKLEGLDDDWIDAGTRRLAYFSHVPPGNYTFRVIAANSDNIWNEQGATLKIVVLPPFYRTWWFLLTCAALCSLIIYAIYRRRVLKVEGARRLQQDFSRRLINANETERRRVAGELHDSIGQSLAIIKNRVVLSAESVTDEKVRRQLELITAQTTQTISEVREISYALRPYLLDNLGLTKAVDSLLDKIAETSKLTIDSELDDVDNVFDGEAEMSIYRIIQESLSNIMKHAEASEAQVFVKKSERNLTILISDDGKGYDLNVVESRDLGDGGFGLLGISERVKMLGGTQEIESKIGGGTTVLIKIPVPNAGTLAE